MTATNTTTGEVASSATSDIAVTVNPLAENPVLGEASASVTVSEGSQGNALGLTLAPVDSDDVLSVSISGVPSDATLNAGTFNSSTQTWTLSAAQLAALGGLGNLTLNAGETSGTLTIDGHQRGRRLGAGDAGADREPGPGSTEPCRHGTGGERG